MASSYHVNFHTAHGGPVLLDDVYAHFVDETLGEIISHHGIVCLARVVMPTHVHCIIVSFSDQLRGHIVQLLKGGSAHTFLARFPDWRAEIGDHLWQEAYHWVQITTHRQLAATIKYVEDNRTRTGLDPLRSVTPIGQLSASPETPPPAENRTIAEAL